MTRHLNIRRRAAASACVCPAMPCDPDTSTFARILILLGASSYSPLIARVKLSFSARSDAHNTRRLLAGFRRMVEKQQLLPSPPPTQLAPDNPITALLTLTLTLTTVPAFIHQRVDMALPNVLGVIAGDAANVYRSPSPRRGVLGVTRCGSKNAAAAVTLTTGYGLSTCKNYQESNKCRLSIEKTHLVTKPVIQMSKLKRQHISFVLPQTLQLKLMLANLFLSRQKEAIA